MNRKIQSEEKIVLFMSEYCGYLWNRLHVGEDGLTNYEKVKGKKASVLAVEFGEKLLYKVKPKNKLEKLNSRWEYGIFVGVKKLSGELWVATQEGLKAVRSVKRIPAERRWSEDCCRWVRHVPWHRFDGDPEADGEIPAFKAPMQSELGGSSEAPKLIVVNTREVAPREFHIRQSNLEKYGHTKDCRGCETLIRGGARQPHNEQCRGRFRELLKDDEKVVRTAEKRTEYENKLIAKQMEKRLKKEEKEGQAAAAGGESGSSRDHLKREAQEGLEDLVQADEEEEEEVQDADMNHGDVDEVGELFEEDVLAGEYAWDDVLGGYIKPSLVRAARQEEIYFMKERGIWEDSTEEESWRLTGKEPVSVRWVDTNKGTEKEPNVRSRMVARDFKGKDKDREDLFAATPAWEL